MPLVFMHRQRQARALGQDNAVSQFRPGDPRFVCRHLAIPDRHPERRDALQALYDGRAYEPPLASSLSLRNLCARSAELGELLDAHLNAEDVPTFTDWVLHRVILVGIEAPSRDCGFQIFESMNDRGARLTPVDLLKSYLLSNVRSEADVTAVRTPSTPLAGLAPRRSSTPGKTTRSLGSAMTPDLISCTTRSSYTAGQR